jgi:hypothetical protein
MKIFTLPGSIVGTLSIGILLFSLGCANDPMRYSPTVSRLESYGIQSDTYERITMGEPLIYEDVMNLEACHVPQETINYLYAKQNNDYFKKKYHSYAPPSSQVVVEENREFPDAEIKKAAHEAAHEAEHQLQQLADKGSRNSLAAEAEERVKEGAKKATHEAKHQLQRLAEEKNRKHLFAEAEVREKAEAKKATHEAEDQLKRLKKVF